MAWPSTVAIWGDDLEGVQANIAQVARAIARFEPVSILARGDQVARIQRLGANISVVEAPVDDLWARDTLPSLVLKRVSRGVSQMAAVRTRFNGWGQKQTHDGDSQLARILATHLGVELIETGLCGEGGGLEFDGHGTLLAAESCWVNNNRNPGKTRAQIERALSDALGIDRMLWIDGLAGADITDGHIDTLGRFANERTLVIDKPSSSDRADPWIAVAMRTKQQLSEMRTNINSPYRLIELTQPSHTRRTGDAFLSTYMNYYVCNGAVIAPEFGDAVADLRAREVLSELFVGREVVQLNIDSLAAGGGGIHCATQQEPARVGEVAA